MTDSDRPEEAKDATSPDEERRGLPASFKIGVVFVLLLGGVTFLLLNSDAGDALAYSTVVQDVVDAPERFGDRQLRVEGELKPGSIRFRVEPCEWRFTIAREGRELPVRFPQCVVPDTFRDGFGIKVIVQGHLTDEGGFLANQVIPQCPSKYEMQERMQSGEEVPHGMPGPEEAI